MSAINSVRDAMTANEIKLAEAICNAINTNNSIANMPLPAVMVGDLRKDLTAVEAWQSYGRPHLLMLQEQVPEIGSDIVVFMDYGYGKTWAAVKSSDYTDENPKFSSVIVGNTPLVIEIPETKRVHTVLDASSCSWNAWGEPFSQAKSSRQINFTISPI